MAGSVVDAEVGGAATGALAGGGGGTVPDLAADRALGTAVRGALGVSPEISY